MTQTNSAQGTYTKIPNILYDRCDLPAELAYTFEKLCRQIAYKDCSYTGSYSKLAEQLRITKNKAFRMVKGLETAHLLQVHESTELVFTLNIDDLWMLNTLADADFAIPYWSDLKSTLESVLKIERDKRGKIVNSDAIVLILVQSVLKIEQIVLISERIGLKIERNVLEIERQKEAVNEPEKPAETPVSESPNNYKTIKTVKNRRSAANATKPPATFQPVLVAEEKPKKQTKPVVTLDTPEQERFWSLWCSVWFNQEATPTLNETAKGHVVNLAPRFKTQDQLDSYERFTRKELEESGLKRKTIFLGNLDNEDRYIRWKQTQPAPDNVTSLTEKKPANRYTSTSYEEMRNTSVWAGFEQKIKRTAN